MNKNILFLALLFVSLMKGFAQAPIADFSSDVTKGCGFTIVKFTDLSTNTPTSWLWNFGDGTANSILQNPIHAYVSPGTYTVTLTAKNASGLSTKTGTIVIYALPIANFTSDINIGCTPIGINFSNTSTLGSAPISNQQWNFGDGTSSTLYNASHTYTTAGLFQVSLSVTDTNGCTNKAVKNNYITINQSPTATFSATPIQSCTPPLTTNFTNTSTGAGLTYEWLFGDGVTSTTLNPSNTYTISGSYAPTLIVRDTLGCSDTAIISIPIEVGTYKSLFTSNQTSGCRPLSIQFADTTNGSVSWEWHFGDGTTSNLKTPSHTYPNPGNYTITLITANASGCIDTLISNNYITVFSPATVDFTADKTEDCAVPFTVNFTDNSSSATAWQWYFGDGTTSTLQNPSHSYTNLGSDTVTLIITNANGCSDTLIKPDYIKLRKPTASFTATPTQGCLPTPVTFTSTSTSVNPIVTWEYDFGDGATANIANPTHTPTDTGSYTVKHIIVDSKGCSDTVIMPNFINIGMKPVTSFSGTPISGCHPLSVQFTNTTSSYTDTWQWIFGNNGTSTMADPIHIFSDTGTFSITLISGHKGCFDTISIANYITVFPPRAQFTATPQTSCTSPSVVQFFDGSASAETWFWDFGDGNTSTLQNPTNSYTSGQYTVKLVVTNSNGCKDSVTNINYIQVSGFNIGFMQDTSKVCQKSNLRFTDTTHSVMPIINRTWDFGDGTIVSTDSATVTHAYSTFGNFTIKLIVTDTNNCSDSILKSALIDVSSLPTPIFTADTTIGCSPLAITFDSQLSSAILPDTISQWSWDFGDGQTSTDQNPTHTYLTRGNYTVQLTVTTSQGCDSTLTKINYIKPSYPYPNFNNTSTICYSDSVQFINTSTGTALTYAWDFGDGTSSTAASPYHKYTVDTTTVFNVSLTATDANGCDSTIIKTITVSRPDSKFSSNNISGFCPPLFVPFNNESSSDVNSWKWDFGDPSSGGSNISNQTNPQHVFENPGIYTITLSVVNTDGCADTLVIPNYVSVDGPVGTFTFTPIKGCSPLSVQFKANAIKTDSYTWVFGDGSSITTLEDTVTYQYITGGVYVPVLVMNNFTTSPGDTCSISIISPQSLQVNSAEIDFSVIDSFACNPTIFQFYEFTTAYPAIDSCRWNFGDGTSQVLTYPASYPLSHNYTSNGIFDVTLDMYVNGCSYSLEKKDLVNIFTPRLIQFAPTDTAGCPPLITNLTVLDSTFTDSVATWSWNFDDGSPLDFNKNTTHQYTLSNTYNIALTANFENGCTATYIQPTPISVYAHPVAQFATDTNYVYAGENITFMDLTPGTITNWSWDFGDGNTSNVKNPMHNYSLFDTYVTTLIVTTNHGCIDSTSRTIEIIERIEIPNAFTPDGDGINDVFMKGTDLTILNRWGQVLYNGTEGWDGTYKNNQALPGTYYFILIINDIKDHPKNYQGSVTLIRK